MRSVQGLSSDKSQPSKSSSSTIPIITPPSPEKKNASPEQGIAVAATHENPCKETKCKKTPITAGIQRDLNPLLLKSPHKSMHCNGEGKEKSKHLPGEIFLLCLYIFLVNNPFYAAQCNPNVVVCVCCCLQTLPALCVSASLSTLSISSSRRGVMSFKTTAS